MKVNMDQYRGIPKFHNISQVHDAEGKILGNTSQNISATDGIDKITFFDMVYKCLKSYENIQDG